MNSQKDIFDFFRNNERLLNEKPPLRTWRQLERRLDAHQSRGRVVLFRSLGMVAAVLLLVSIIVLMAVLFENRQEYLSGTPQDLEYLHSGEGDPTAYEAVELARLSYDSRARGIEEGTPNKRLVPVQQ